MAARKVLIVTGDAGESLEAELIAFLKKRAPVQQQMAARP